MLAADAFAPAVRLLVVQDWDGFLEDHVLLTVKGSIFCCPSCSGEPRFCELGGECLNPWMFCNFMSDQHRLLVWQFVLFQVGPEPVVI